MGFKTVNEACRNTCVRRKPNITADKLNSHRLPHGADENTQISQHGPGPEHSHRSTNIAAAFKLIYWGEGTVDVKAKWFNRF